MKSDIRIIAIPRPNTVHFQTFLRNMPGSRIPRMSPIAGNRKSPYITHVGSPNSVRVTDHPRRIVASTMRAKATRVIRIVLSVGFWASLETRFIMMIKGWKYGNGGEREIRTPGILRYAPFPRVCTRPLCDLSKLEFRTESWELRFLQNTSKPRKRGFVLIFWSEQWDSNPQRPPWQGGTLANWAMLAYELHYIYIW